MHCAGSPTRSSIGRLSQSQLQSVWVSLWAWPAVPLLEARCERPRGHRAAEKRDEFAPFQLIELHSIPASQGRGAGIELQAISQRACWNFATSLGSAYAGGRPPATHSVR